MPDQKTNSISSLVAAGLILILVLVSACQHIEKLDQGAGTPNRIEAVVPASGMEQNAADNATGIYLLVDKPGVYQICPDEAAFDFPPDPQSIMILNQNEPIPTWVSPIDGDLCIRFWAGDAGDRYLMQSVFQLRLVEGEVVKFINQELALVDEPAGPDVPAAKISNFFEENVIYEPRFSEDVPWLWERVPIDKTANHEIDLSGINSDNAELYLVLWAKTDSPVMLNGEQGDHQVSVMLNSKHDTQISWRGSGVYSANLRVDGLGTGTVEKLRIDISLALPEGAIGDTVYLDKLILIGQPSSYTTPGRYSGGSFFLPMDQAQEALEIVEFHDGKPNRLLVTTPGIAGTYTLTDKPGESYWFFRNQDVLSPEWIIHESPGINLLRKDFEVDYLVLGQREFQPTLQRLMEARKQEGLRPLFVDLAAVYDQFGDGSPKPQAIREFLKYAHDNWQRPPRYILLVGDASYKILDYRSPEMDWSLPSSFIYTDLGGWTLSDSDLVDFDRDGAPDLAVGRLPVQHQAELEIVIEKILAYDNQTQQTQGSRGVTLVTESDPQLFNGLSAEFAASIPASLPLLSFGITPSDTGQEWMINFVHEPDTPVLVFIGHGSLNQLTDLGTLRSDDLDRLNEATEYGIMAMFTCLTGYFAHPEVDSLGELLLEHPGTGMAAVIAPTSLTLPAQQSTLVGAFADAFADPSVQRIGDLVLRAQTSSVNNAEIDLDLLRTWVLLGDPAMHFKP